MTIDTKTLRDLLAALEDDSREGAAQFEAAAQIIAAVPTLLEQIDTLAAANADLRRQAAHETEVAQAAAEEVERLKAENARLRTRLEVNDKAPAYDGIACRDETIKGQDRHIDDLRAENAALRNALELFLAHSPEPECAIWRHVHAVANAALQETPHDR